MSGFEGPIVMIVLDGVGEVADPTGNAVALAHTPHWDRLRTQQRFTTLKAHGKAVGLPSDKDMGNSEVGHNALGSGQVYDQGAKLVIDAINSGSLFEGATWNTAVNRVRGGDATLHFLGLLSDGNVHSHIDHLKAMLARAASEGVKRARVHCLLDGRDVSGQSAHLYIEDLEAHLTELNREGGRDYRIASGGGRMKITMDRYEADWAMVERGWKLHVHGEGPAFAKAIDAVNHYRAENPSLIDQDMGSFVIVENGEPVGKVQDGDAFLLFNFRGDRAIEISRAFDEGPAFPGFDRGHKPDVFYAGMMEYDGDTRSPKNYLVGPPNITDTLTDYLVDAGVSQFAVSETQKFGHITYFWNGNRSGKVSETLEDYCHIPSDNVSFDERPWMKAAEITDELIKALASGKYRFLRANYANGDMVGHTGSLEAAMIAMTCMDLQINRLLKAVDKAGGIAFFTADHGNCEEMFEMKGGKPVLDGSGAPKVKTSHSLSPVPFVFYDPSARVKGGLATGADLGIGNAAATITDIMGLGTPATWMPSLLRSA